MLFCLCVRISVVPIHKSGKCKRRGQRSRVIARNMTEHIEVGIIREEEYMMLQNHRIILCGSVCVLIA